MSTRQYGTPNSRPYPAGISREHSRRAPQVVQVLFLTPILCALCALAVSQKDPPQPVIPSLPQPSGQFGIGRVAFDWVDPSRAADMAEDPAARVQLMVYLWYPTKAPAKDTVGVLFPGAKAINSDPAVSQGLKDKIFGGNWTLVASGTITSHAQENGAIAKRPKAFP